MNGKPDGIFRILHFSDVHLGLRDFHAAYLLDKRFFGRLNQFVTRQCRLRQDALALFLDLLQSRAADFLLCTGDLTSIGSQEEFHHVEERLKPILEASQGRFLFVPGNHDAYIKGCQTDLQEAFNRLNGGRLRYDELPALLPCGPVEFVVLNPARPCRIWQSTGELTEVAWKKLDYILQKPCAKGKSRIVVSHFPLCDHRGKPLSWRTKFLQGERLLAHAAAGHFDALATGHVHHPFVQPLPGAENVLAIGAGSLTLFGCCAQIDVHPNTGKLIAETIIT